ncbi:MAG: hypothetical protein M9928_15630 [Anaerolineae bacterium]|nr:hypothetical protein [Anaerolineae bacterium]MCO5194556.1 hypothetical protein [Anaerolineae bacterium]MCO5199629.1 hypothetical protein [Anaerolineae bacterium]MCO5206467.1 hypothetical protein [Anaerolineae bacterium]
MPLGPRDTSNLVLPAAWDAATLASLQLQDGITYKQILRDLNAAIVAINAELAADPLYSALLSYTSRPTVRYRVGATSDMKQFTEYAKGDPQRADHDSHMLPLLKWDHSMSWTWLYLREAFSEDVYDDIRLAIDAVRNRVRKLTLNRILSRSDDSGVNKGLGSTGLSPGFATAAAVTGVDYTPPQYAGNEFDENHEHYIADAGGYDAALLQAVKANLREHGHSPPYMLLASESDDTALRSVTGFVPVAESLVAYGQNQNLAVRPAQINNTAYRIGTVEDFDIVLQPGMPQHYGFTWKSYGPNSPMNPLRMRVERGASMFNAIARTDPRQNNTEPLQNMMVYAEAGVGVYDRTNGVVLYVNDTTWENGTAS